MVNATQVKSVDKGFRVSLPSLLYSFNHAVAQP